ncbi:MAG: hypothetical protein AB1656_10650 [Candidatus Omnitrophota bacterium]
MNMSLKCPIILFAISFFALSPISYATDSISEANLFSVLPPQAAVAFRIVSIQDMGAHFDAFMEKAAGFTAPDQIETIVKSPFELKSLDGMAKDQSVWAFLFLNEIDDYEPEDYLVCRYPLSDESQFLAQFPLDKTGDGEYASGDLRIWSRDGAAILCKKKAEEIVKAWLKEKDSFSPVKDWPRKNGEDAALWINLEKILGQVGGEIEKEFENTVQHKSVHADALIESVSPIAAMKAKWGLDLLRQIESVHLSLGFSAESALLEKNIRIRSGSPLAQFFAAFTPADPMPLLSALPAQGILHYFVNIPPCFFDMSRERILRDATKAEADGKGLGETWTLAAKTLTGLQAGAVELADKEDQLVQFTHLFDVSNREAALELAKTHIEWMKRAAASLFDGGEILCSIQDRPNAGKVGEFPYSTLRIAFDAKDPESPLSNELAAFNVNLEYAAVANAFAVSTGKIVPVLQKLNQPAAASNASAWPAAADRSAFFAARFNLMQQFKAIQRALAKGPINLLAGLQIPEAPMEGFAISVQTKGETLTGRLILPSKDIRAVVTLFMGEKPALGE